MKLASEGGRKLRERYFIQHLRQRLKFYFFFAFVRESKSTIEQRGFS